MNEKLKGLFDKAAAMKSAAETKGEWDENSVKAYERLLGEIDREKAQLDLEKRHDALKAWAEAPDGQSVVKASFGREAGPTEGDIPQVTAEGGDLYALGPVGEEKIKTLKSGAYKSAFNDYIRAAGLGRAMKGDAMKVLQEGQDTAGGFWVPPDTRSEVVKKIATMATIRPNAFAFTTGSDLVRFPKVVYTTDDKYTSGVRLAWTAEAPSADISESTNPAAGQVNIPVQTATAAIILTRAMIEDNQFDLLGYISALLSEAFGLGENDVFINGTGAGQPEGILSHPNATVANGSGGMYVASSAASALAWQESGGSTKGIIGLESVLPPQYERNAKWYAAKATFAAIRGLVDTQNRPMWNLGDSYPNFANGMSPSLLGYPIVKDQFIPAIAANAYPIIFGDLSGYYIADRVGLSVEVLREVRALRDEVVVYARKRVGGQLVQDWKVKLQKVATS